MYNAKATAIAIVATMFVIAAMPTQAIAEDAGTVGDLGKVQSNTMMLKAKIREQEAQAALRRGDGQSESGVPKAPESVTAVLPNVKLISSGESGPYAVLLYADGATSAGGEGRKVPGGLTIKSISAASRSVDVVDANGKRHTLGMSSTPPIVPPQPPAATMGMAGPMGATSPMAGMSPVMVRPR